MTKFNSIRAAEEDLTRRAEHMEFETGKPFEVCYTQLLNDTTDPAVIKLNDRRKPSIIKFAEYQNAETELDTLAQKAMLRKEVSYSRAFNFAMAERPDLAKIYLRGGKVLND